MSQTTRETILVIDDEAHIRRIIELKSRNAGYRVIATINGKKAYRSLKVKNQMPSSLISICPKWMAERSVK